MAIPESYRRNFETLLRAAAEGNLALVECRDAISGETRYVICALAHHEGTYALTPFGHLHAGNPYEAYVPPFEDGS